jgi:hypothetical protein
VFSPLGSVLYLLYCFPLWILWIVTVGQGSFKKKNYCWTSVILVAFSLLYITHNCVLRNKINVSLRVVNIVCWNCQVFWWLSDIHFDEYFFPLAISFGERCWNRMEKSLLWNWMAGTDHCQKWNKENRIFRALPKQKNLYLYLYLIIKR